VERHGGEVHACNAQDGGAVFTVTLPAAPARTAVPAVPAEPRPRRAAGRRGTA
jgi:hypothetical protein